ncbi:MAG: hypothetical protein ACU0DX_16085, partial [Roseovarius sp.]
MARPVQTTGAVMPVATFHIGMPKCATTTIQSFLEARADWLATQGQIYERHPEDRTRNQGNAAQLAA